MRERIKTLIVDANGIPNTKVILVDTLLQGIFRLNSTVPDRLPAGLGKSPLVSKLLGQRYESLSYIVDWREELCNTPELDTKVCNIANLVDYLACRKAIVEYPLIVILHSAAGDSMSVLLQTKEWFQRRKGKLVVFLGNEYDLLDEKIRFIQSTQADIICSQLPAEAAQWLYSECSPTKILTMPHALNPQLYFPDDVAQRQIDIGFAGDLYHRIIGDGERTDLIEYFQTRGSSLGFHCDIRFNRFQRNDWAKFLRNCKGIIGAEAGTYYLDRRGQGIARAKAYAKTHPTATLEEIRMECFAGLDVISGKSISSRHFEAAGTKTCQILIDGKYNGILEADKHYIGVKKDLSNIEDVIQKFKDEAYRNLIANQAYEHVIAEHTYQIRIATLLNAVLN
jgi:hypothetical protein